MKFKIGDKVKVISHHCAEFRGTTGTVEAVYGHFSIKNNRIGIEINVHLDKPVATSWSGNNDVYYISCTEDQLAMVTPRHSGRYPWGKGGREIPEIRNVYFNDPLTIVLWEDDTKTFVKNADGDAYYDPEKALAMAISKKALGNKYHYYKEFEKWLPETEEEASMEKLNKALSALTAISAMLPKSSNSSNPVERAYRILMDVNDDPTSTDADFAVAIEAAIGYLGEALDE